MLQVAAIFQTIVVLTTAEVIPIDQYKQQLLDIHNDYRSQQHGSDMQELTWSNELAEEAQEWIKQCRFEHQKKTRGENLGYQAMPGQTIEEDVSKSVKAWYDEIKTYRYGAHSCGSSCHYTQLVWSKTRKMGCALEKCKGLLAFGRRVSNATFLACFYFPKGNDITKTPYNNKGDACTACDKDQSCDSKGLCTGGKEVELNPCEDKSPDCKLWKSTSQCSSNPAYMKDYCAKSCRFCTPKPGQEEEEEEEEELPCQDDNTSCGVWYKAGECYRNPKYMNDNCRKSCGRC